MASSDSKRRAAAFASFVRSPPHPKAPASCQRCRVGRRADPSSHPSPPAAPPAPPLTRLATLRVRPQHAFQKSGLTAIDLSALTGLTSIGPVRARATHPPPPLPLPRLPAPPTPRRSQARRARAAASGLARATPPRRCVAGRLSHCDASRRCGAAQWAFYACPSLRSASLPASVTSIGWVRPAMRSIRT